MSKINLFKALANFQQEVPVIHKDTQGYGYTYADLPKVFEVINPLLKKHGLGFSQLMQGQSIQTIVFHLESGETLESTTDIPQNVSLKGMNEFQVLGSAITYLRRYSISSILGLVTDKDTDAGGEQKAKTPADNKETPKTTATDLPWLNKVDKAGKLTPEWQKLIEFKQGGKLTSVAQVRKSYKVSKEIEIEINKLINT
jgi:ERF superfamily